MTDKKPRNKRRIKITGSTYEGRGLAMFCEKVLLLRTARKVGDEEAVNNTVLGRLNDNKITIQYEVVEEKSDQKQ